jgi:hypothetical protein
MKALGCLRLLDPPSVKFGIRQIVLKNSAFHSGALKSNHFRSAQLPEIDFGAENFIELHSLCRCGRENLRKFMCQEFFYTIGTEQ